MSCCLPKMQMDIGQVFWTQQRKVIFTISGLLDRLWDTDLPAWIRHSHGFDICSDFAYGFVQLGLSADECSLRYEAFGGRESDSAATARNYGYLPL